ncbi:MAG: glycosyltransferase [Nostoc sp. C3-bin3]|nr:glycosyltransferase [Nostoc sp. C3-bin3]
MKVSIITVVRNNQATIAHAIDSVLSQDYPNIEYIVIDGCSTDSTVAIAKSYGQKITQLVSEPDLGMYDAMNKGLKLATGDIVGFLNSDDFYTNSSVISQVVRQFRQQQVDLVFGDIVFVHPQNTQKVIRYYSSANFRPELFRWGWMPAHPSCFIKRRVYQEYGDFSTDYLLAADYELLLRFMAIHRLSYAHLPQILVKMRPGGASNRNLACRWISNLEVLKACREHGISTNLFQLLARYPAKILEKFFIPSLPKTQPTLPSPAYEHSRN